MDIAGRKEAAFLKVGGFIRLRVPRGSPLWFGLRRPHIARQKAGHALLPLWLRATQVLLRFPRRNVVSFSVRRGGADGRVRRWERADAGAGRVAV